MPFLSLILFLASSEVKKNVEFAVSPLSGEEINLIMNGWWMERVKNFPPSSKINPVWISFHVSRPDLIKNCKNYFKKQPPIGCRDQATVDLFQKNGIDAYFTGCLTLFFDKYNGVTNYREIYLCD